jgi:two-component system response regulator YesN
MLNLMIVDDEQLIREELQSKIMRIAHPAIGIIKLAADCNEALQAMKAFKPQIIISDIQMPGNDGLSLIRECSISHPDVKFIVLSGHDDYGYVRDAFKYGVVDYLLKPVRLAELEAQLNQAISQYKDGSPQNNQLKPEGVASEKDEKPASGRETVNPTRSMIGIVKQYIEDRPFGNVTLAEVSNLISMNYNYFSTWFKDETGLTFSAYVMKLRMEQAKRLLEDPTTRINEVAVQVGYENIYHFSRAFKNYTGLSPKEYRKGADEM